MPIRYVVLGIEADGFDSSVSSFAGNIGFEAALDLVEEGGIRTSIRNGFSYYSGEPASRSPSQLGSSVRRRFVILDGQAGPEQWKVLYVSNNFSSGQASTVRSIIDSVVGPQSSTPQVDITTTAMPVDGGMVNTIGLVDDGAEVALVATANTGFRFDRWSGGDVASPMSPETTLLATADSNITAIFVPISTLMVSARAGGTVAGGGVFDRGTIVAINATPDPGFRFDRWEGDGIVAPLEPTTSVTLSGDTTATANFVRVWKLSISVSEGGSVDGAGLYDSESQVTLTATPEEGYRFGGWTGPVADVDALQTQVTLTEDVTIEANFVKVWNLTVTGSEGGSVEGSGIFDEGMETTVIATPEEGYRFGGWTGPVADVDALQTQVTLTEDTTIEANFVKVWRVGLEAGEGGRVEGGGVVDEGSTIPVTAIPDDGFRFDSWIGEGITDPTSAVTEVAAVTGEVTLQATFVKVWAIVLEAQEGGTAEGAGTLDAGSTARLTAMPAEGYRFGGWVGELGERDPTSPVLEVRVQNDLTLEARFVKVWELTLIAASGGQVEGGGVVDESVPTTIRALPEEGFRFVQWQGDAIDAVMVPADALTTVALTGDLTLEALFEAIPPADPDPDGDGLPTEWEERHQLDPMDPSDAALDKDNDGLSNQDEFLAATDPNNPQSRLHIRVIEIQGESVSITWESVAGLRYVLESGTLNAEPMWGPVDEWEAEGPTSTITTTRDTGPFYRIRVLTAASAPE